jgi:hypothetical protein
MFLSSRVFARFARFDDMPGYANQHRGQKLFKVTRAFLPIKHMDASRNDRYAGAPRNIPIAQGAMPLE